MWHSCLVYTPCWRIWSFCSTNEMIIEPFNYNYQAAVECRMRTRVHYKKKQQRTKDIRDKFWKRADRCIFNFNFVNWCIIKNDVDRNLHTFSLRRFSSWSQKFSHEMNKSATTDLLKTMFVLIAIMETVDSSETESELKVLKHFHL